MEILKRVDFVEKIFKSTNKFELELIQSSKQVKYEELLGLENELNISFPKKLRDFYLNETEFVFFKWSTTPDVFGTECKRGYLNILSPTQILDLYNDMRQIVEEAKRDQDVAHNEGLKALLNDWIFWIPIIFFPNGDAFCLDTRESKYPIVFLEHDVMDGGPYIHGIKIAENFSDLIEKWSKIGFVDVYDWSQYVDEKGIDLSKPVFNNFLNMLK